MTQKILFGIRLSVTKVTAIETNEGIGERSREALGESKGRAVCTCYDALGWSRKACQEDRKVFWAPG